MNIEWRSLTEEDIPAWAELARAAEEVDQEDEHLSEDDLAEEFAAPLFDPERGTLAGFDGQAMVALGQLQPRSAADPAHRMGYYGVVHPAYRGRGLGARLLSWAPEPAKRLHEERYPGARLILTTGCISTNGAAAALFERFGYAPTRYYHGMQRDLDADLPPIVPVDGVEIVPYSPEIDELARLVTNEAFKDHWGSSPALPEQWQAWHAQSTSFRPDLSFLAVSESNPDFGGVVGVLITKYFEAATAATGRREAYIATLGTLRSVRRRGLGTALLGTALRAARAAGFDAAWLSVDSENPTGALSVYEHAGLIVKDTYVAYAQEL